MASGGSETCSGSSTPPPAQAPSKAAPSKAHRLLDDLRAGQGRGCGWESGMNPSGARNRIVTTVAVLFGGLGHLTDSPV
jgi:hypothetical protein